MDKNLVITTPQDRHPESAVRQHRSRRARTRCARAVLGTAAYAERTVSPTSAATGAARQLMPQHGEHCTYGCRARHIHAQPNIARPSPTLATPRPAKQKGKVWDRPFQKGQSGNPGGKAKAKENIVDIARQATPKAIRTMISIMENEKAPYSVRAYCADKVIDRAWGKPAQQTNVTVGIAQRSLAQLSDAELLDIIENGAARPRCLRLRRPRSRLRSSLRSSLSPVKHDAAKPEPEQRDDKAA